MDRMASGSASVIGNLEDRPSRMRIGRETMGTFPMNQLGGRQTGQTTLGFAVLLPWVTPANLQSVQALVIHENDQYLQNIPAVSRDPDIAVGKGAASAR
jgi:hypothetical protein